MFRVGDKVQMSEYAKMLFRDRLNEPKDLGAFARGPLTVKSYRTVSAGYSYTVVNSQGVLKEFWDKYLELAKVKYKKNLPEWW